MRSDSEKAFRLQGIPGSFDTEKVVRLLRDALHLGEDIKVFVRSFAANPLRPNERVATVHFSSVPEELCRSEEYTLDVAQDELDCGDCNDEFTLDTHFEGFTPLHKAPDTDCDVDIVALSGLNGHAFGSFKAKGTHRMWLRDALPQDLPNARVFTYGYKQKDSFHNIYDLGNSFCSRLKNLRRKSSRLRRLVVIAHSLGGLILKAAIVHMAESKDQRDRQILYCLQAGLLFGVPNQGMNIASLIPMIPESARNTLLYSLDDTNSPTLYDLNKRFPEAVASLQNFQCLNFYETRESPTAQQRADGSWKMDGPPAVIVKPPSATQGNPHAGAHGFNRTHSDLVKFGKNDTDYATVLGCIEDATEVVIQQSRIMSEEERDCLQSLSFLEQDWRENQTAIKAAQGTCGWFVEHAHFRSWLESRTGLLWILGSPGAGKSTVMKYAVQNHKSFTRDKEVVVTFFIHARGSNELQKSPLGLFRSLLHQLLPRYPEQLACLTGIYREREEQRGRSGHSWVWLEDDLKSALEHLLSGLASNQSLTIFVDALDEMGQKDAEDVIMEFAALVQKARRLDVALKVCFSCRYYPIIYETEGGRIRVQAKNSDEKELGECIRVEQENTNDIKTFVHTHPSLKSARKDLKEIITTRANGVFIWVALVVEEAVKLMKERRPHSAIKSMVDRVPSDLTELYKTLLVFESPHDERRRTLKLFQWILFSIRPLSLAELRHALAIDADMPQLSFSEIQEEGMCTATIDDMESYIRALSKGLAEVRTFKKKDPGRGSPQLDYIDIGPNFDQNLKRIELIHQSVSDFLMGGGLELLDDAELGSAVIRGHFQLSRSCIRYLQLNEIQEYPFTFDEWKNADRLDDNEPDITLFFYRSSWKRNRLSHLSSGKWALTEYARWFWIYHVMKVEEGPKGHWNDLFKRRLINLPACQKPRPYGQEDLLQLFSWRSCDDSLPILFTPDLNDGGPFWVEDLKNDPNFDLIRVSHDHTSSYCDFWDEQKISCLRRLYEDQWNDKVKRSENQRLHLIMAFTGILSVLEQMQVQCASEWERNAPDLLANALIGRHDAIISHIVGSTKNWHTTPRTGFACQWPPLMLSVSIGHEDLVEALLQKDVDVNIASKDSGGVFVYPLDVAVTAGNEVITKRLLEAGADKFHESRFLAPDMENNYMTTALHYSVATGKLGVVKVLLEQDCDAVESQDYVNMKDSHGKTPIFHTFNHLGDPRIMEILLHFGADTTATDGSGNSFFFYWIKCFQGDATDQVLIKWRDVEGKTVLMLQMASDETGRAYDTFLGLLEGILLIDEAYLDVQTRRGDTLLSMAASSGLHSHVKLLLDYQANVNTRDIDGYTPLMKSVFHGNYEVVYLLLKCDTTDPETTVTLEWKTPDWTISIGNECTFLCFSTRAD